MAGKPKNEAVVDNSEVLDAIKSMANMFGSRIDTLNARIDALETRAMTYAATPQRESSVDAAVAAALSAMPMLVTALSSHSLERDKRVGEMVDSMFDRMGRAAISNTMRERGEKGNKIKAVKKIENEQPAALVGKSNFDAECEECRATKERRAPEHSDDLTRHVTENHQGSTLFQ